MVRKGNRCIQQRDLDGGHLEKHGRVSGGVDTAVHLPGRRAPGQMRPDPGLGEARRPRVLEVRPVVADQRGDTGRTCTAAVATTVACTGQIPDEVGDQAARRVQQLLEGSRVPGGVHQPTSIQ